MTAMAVTGLDDGFGGFATLLLIAVLAHEPWRWLGLALGRGLTVDSEIFIWVRAVATALVAGLVMRLILFPAGTLADIAVSARLAGLLCGIAVFFLAGRSLGAGVTAAAIILIASAKLLS
jgi:Branched-chain amino acid transport protein (AzlD)